MHFMEKIKGLCFTKISKRLLTGPKTLQGELIISITAGMLAIFIPINIVNSIRETETAVQNTKERLVEQGVFVYFGVRKWRKSMTEMMQLLAFAPQIRSLNSDSTEIIFNRLSTLFPHRSWRLWNSSGDLLVGTNVLEPSSRQRMLSRKYFQESKRGKPSYGIFKKCLNNKSCYVESVPVFAPGVSNFSTKTDLPVGVLSIAIALDDTGKDSGLDGYYNQIIGSTNTNRNKTAINNPSIHPISLHKGIKKGTEVLMVSKQGYVIFPITTINDDISLESPEVIMKGPWGPFVKLGLSATDNGKFQVVSTVGKEYFAYTKTIDNVWSLVAVSDKESSLKTAYDKVREQMAYQLLTVLGVLAGIFLVSKRYAKRIEVAATTIRGFSEGDFEARIISKREGAMGHLYKDINQTGAKLRELLTSQLAHAITDQQIKTATDIQKSFIVEMLPKSSKVELAGDFEPAYEIGADWYDALSLENITYIVIADVCDKGIASALFMSVFRSLTRYSILVLTEKSKNKEIKIAEVLKDAIIQVNDYMATNHGKASMFATLFLGAYTEATQELSYVCAGHETPIIIRSEGVLEKLETTGPAIGIFPQAEYNVKTIELKPGQIVFTYTDGLIDARSPTDESWGMEGIEGVLSGIDPKEMTAKCLVDLMNEKISNHRGDADQFDDLTMLVMKINPS